MVSLNRPTQLPSAAAWYWLVRASFVCGAIVVFAYLLHSGLVSPSCRGSMCGSSGSGFTAFLYLFAVVLAARAIVNALTCEFILSDKSITITRGFVFRNSSTIRFDRIQDVRGTRGPLLDAFGLEAIALWTASPDQRVGNSRRPDGQLYLNRDDAEWLKQFLAEPSASAGTGAAQLGATNAGALPARRSSFAVASVLTFVGALAVWLLIQFLHGVHTSPPVVVGTAAPAPHAAATNVLPASPKLSTPTTPLAPERVADASRVLTCTLAGPNGEQSAIPCHEQAARCARERDFASAPVATPAALTLVNRGPGDLQLYWLNAAGGRQLYGTLTPGARLTQPTHAGAHWLLATRQGQCVGIFDAATVALNVAY
jgi:membrane protein YdbS with pleckstrin-like domain